MNRYLGMGIAIGSVFAGLTTWIATLDASTAGGWALLASTVFGLAAGLSVGGLIAANFAMLAFEHEPREAEAHKPGVAHASV